jgi:hypothetical protein
VVPRVVFRERRPRQDSNLRSRLPRMSRAAVLGEQRPRQDSNLRSRLRRAVLYPLSYGGSGATTLQAHGAGQETGVTRPRGGSLPAILIGRRK